MSSPLKRTASQEIAKEEDWDDVLNFDDLLAEEEVRTQADSEAENLNSTTVDENSASSTGIPSNKAKKQRRSKNSPEPDYSQMVKEQMSSTNRTGQACDRCKGRKMKCDSNPTGCANCCASNVPCTQTDPITRESHTRGEIIRLRQEVAQLRAENEELRRYIRENQTRLQGENVGMGGAVNFPQQGQQGQHQQLAQPGLTGYPVGENMFGTMGVGRRGSLAPDMAAAPLTYGAAGRNSPFQGYNNQSYNQPYGQGSFGLQTPLPSFPAPAGYSTLNNTAATSNNAGYLPPMTASQSPPSSMTPGYATFNFPTTNPPRSTTRPNIMNWQQRGQRQLQQFQAREAHQQALQAQQQAQQARSRHTNTSSHPRQNENYGNEPDTMSENHHGYSDDNVFQ